MRALRQLEGLVDQIPSMWQIVIAVALVLYSAASIYGRMNPTFGARIFSRVEPSAIRSDKGHIIAYTVIPAIVTVGYVLLLLSKQEQ